MWLSGFAFAPAGAAWPAQTCAPQPVESSTPRRSLLSAGGGGNGSPPPPSPRAQRLYGLVAVPFGCRKRGAPAWQPGTGSSYSAVAPPSPSGAARAWLSPVTGLTLYAPNPRLIGGPKSAPGDTDAQAWTLPGLPSRPVGPTALSGTVERPRLAWSLLVLRAGADTASPTMARSPAPVVPLVHGRMARVGRAPMRPPDRHIGTAAGCYLVKLL